MFEHVQTARVISEKPLINQYFAEEEMKTQKNAGHKKAVSGVSYSKTLLLHQNSLKA